MRLKHSILWQRLFRTRAEDTLPHRITHQRIYIVPSRRGWAFLLAVLLMLLASINYALSLGYALSFLLIGLFAATLLQTYRNVAGLCILQIEADECFSGEPLEFQISLGNERTHKRHGIRLSNRDGQRTATLAALNPEGQTVSTLAVETQQRGLHPLGRLTVQSDWPLGLWTCWSYLHVAVHGLAYPQPESNPPPLPSSLDEESPGEKTPKAQQGDVSGLRNYTPGDSLGSIAWKNAARRQELLVRTFEDNTLPLTAVLTLQKTGNSPIEEQLSRLCAWILNAESKGADYALQLAEVQLSTGHGREHRQRALRALALHGQQPPQQ